jgi:hypothetical protein
MQHEWIGVPSQLSNNEGDTLGHQARDKAYIARKPIEFCNNYAAFRNLGGCQGSCKLGPPVERVGPLAGFKLDELCTDRQCRVGRKLPDCGALRFNAEPGTLRSLGSRRNGCGLQVGANALEPRRFVISCNRSALACLRRSARRVVAIFHVKRCCAADKKSSGVESVRQQATSGGSNVVNRRDLLSTTKHRLGDRQSGARFRKERRKCGNKRLERGCRPSVK